MTIEQFLDGQCDWNRDFDEVPEDRVYELVRGDPRRAWRLAAIDRDRCKTLESELGLRRPELRRVLRAAMLESAKWLTKESQTHYQHARLLIEGILRRDHQPALLFGWQDNRIREWARYAAGLDNGKAHRLASADVLKLLLDGPRSLADLGEDDQGKSGLLDAVRQSVDQAIRSLLGVRAVPPAAWAKLIAIRVVCGIDPEDGDQGLVKDMMGSASLAATAVDDLREALRGGDDAAASRLRALMAGKPDFADLCKHKIFREQCLMLGINPDPRLMEIEYTGPDPWVQNVVREIRDGSPRFELARREWLGLSEADRFSRSKCLNILAKADVYSFGSVVRLVETELAEVDVPEVPDPDMLRLARGLLARAIAVRLTVDDNAMNEAYLKMGGKLFVQWQEEAWQRYQQSAKGSLVPPLMSKHVLRELRPAAMRSDRCFEPMVALVEVFKERLKEDDELREVRDAGREWLHDFVKSLVGVNRLPETVGVRVLEDADRQRLDDWRRRFSSKHKDWCLEALERPGEELRFRECAIRRAERSRSAKPSAGDALDELRTVAEAHCRNMRNQMSGEEQTSAMAALNACVEAVVTGDGDVSPALLTPFRRGDARAFTRRLLGASVDLPVPMRKPSRWGRRSSAWAAVFFGAITWLLLEPALHDGVLRDPPPPPLTDSRFWKPLVRDDDAGLVYHMLTAPELEQLVPNARARALMSVQGPSGVTIRTRSAADELLTRLKAWKRREHPDAPGEPEWPTPKEASRLKSELGVTAMTGEEESALGAFIVIRRD